MCLQVPVLEWQTTVTETDKKKNEILWYDKPLCSFYMADNRSWIRLKMWDLNGTWHCSPVQPAEFKGSPAALQNSRNRLNLMLMSSDAMWVTFRRDQMELVLKEKQKQRVVLFCAPLAEDHIQIQTQDHSCCSGVTVPKQSMLYTNGATGSQQLSCA